MSKRVEIGNWSWDHKHSVRMWLVDKFGVNGDRWKEVSTPGPLYGYEGLVMDDDVYMWYALKWGDADTRSVPQSPFELFSPYPPRGLE